MLSKVFTTAVCAIVLSATFAGAQSLAQLGGPVNLPAAGFSGQQFVDNRGCLFLRAGFGATVNWVPRVDRQHRPLCGYPPTFGAASIAAVEVDVAPAPQVRVTVPVVTAKPVVAKPVIVVARPSYAAADLAGPASGQIGCWSAAPRLERVLLRTGGTALVCTRGDGTLTGWRSPHFPRTAGAGAVLSGRQVTAEMMTGAAVLGSPRNNAVPTPPRGYELAWKDDRLNPLRGVGTAAGQAQQDQVWTQDVPAVLVAVQPRVTAPTAARPRVTVSTMSAPDAPAAQPVARVGASYVQVGTFGEPQNAAGVKARLAALGLPVSTSKITRKGKVLQIVYAGPFGSAAEAKAALTTARGAGFGDAILR